MTKEEILQGNALILEFMNIKPTQVASNDYFWSDLPFYSIHEYTSEKVMNGIIEYAKYHSDWNWLMDIWEKINSMNASISINSANVCITTHVIDHILQDDSYHKYYFFKPSGDNYTPIEALWNAVIDFIKWYNKQNK